MGKAFFLGYFDKIPEVKAKLEAAGIKPGGAWDALFTSPGMLDEIKLGESLSEASVALGEAWLKDGCDGDEVAKATEKYMKPEEPWSSLQWEVMLDKLVDNTCTPASIVLAGQARVGVAPPKKEMVMAMVKKYKWLEQEPNCEIRFRYLRLGMRAGAAELNDQAVKLLKEQGRMKFVRPLYREMMENETTKKLAKDTFAETKTMYHFIARK